MALFMKLIRDFLRTPLGICLELLVYAGMLILICMFFTGNGQFVYENF